MDAIGLVNVPNQLYVTSQRLQAGGGNVKGGQFVRGRVASKEAAQSCFGLGVRYTCTCICDTAV